jgi:signal transduction histidine kinase
MSTSVGTRKSAVLAVAFAALLLVIGVSSVVSWQTSGRTRAKINALHEAHLKCGAALASIQADVYRSGVLIRDYLLDADLSSGGSYASQFDEIQENTRRNFEILKSFVQDPAERGSIDDLQAKLQAYWDPTEVALDWTPEQKLARRSHLLRQKVKKREEIARLARDVEALIAKNFARERDRVSEAQHQARVLLASSTALALLMGFAIAGLTLVRMRTLERKSEEAQNDLRRLSIEIRTTQEAERKYLSRELHDQIGQMLTGLKMELTGLARRLSPGDPDISSRIDRAKSGVEQILGTIRNIAMLLRPSMLDDLGLTPAIQWHAKEASRLSGIHIECEFDETADDVPEPQRTCVYRVVQEALTNCARHARAKQIAIEVRCVPDGVLACVSDNGIGFTAGAAHSGLGLIGIKERVRELNGTFTITSQPKIGTRLEVMLPFEAGEGNDDQSLDSGRSRDSQSRTPITA